MLTTPERHHRALPPVPMNGTLRHCPIQGGVERVRLTGVYHSTRPAGTARHDVSPEPIGRWDQGASRGDPPPHNTIHHHFIIINHHSIRTSQWDRRPAQPSPAQTLSPSQLSDARTARSPWSRERETTSSRDSIFQCSVTELERRNLNPARPPRAPEAAQRIAHHERHLGTRRP